MATFGQTDILASAYSTNGAGIYVVAPESGTLTSITYYVNAAGGSANANVGIYTGTVSAVQTHVAHGTSESVDYTSAGWHTINVSAALTASTGYWLVIQSSASVNFRYTSGLNDNALAYDVAFGGYDTWGNNPTASFFDDYGFSIYGTYTPAATGQTVLPTLGAAALAGVAPSAAQYLFQHATPNADVADGGWLTYYSNGTPGNNVIMYEDINDGNAPNDTNMIRSGLTPSNDTATFGLSPIGTPDAGTVTIKVRARYC